MKRQKQLGLGTKRIQETVLYRSDGAFWSKTINVRYHDSSRPMQGSVRVSISSLPDEEKELNAIQHLAFSYYL